MDRSITLRAYGQEVTVPGGGHSGVRREWDEDARRNLDVALHAQVMTGYPVGVTILLRSDGSWVHWATDFRSDGCYLHFAAFSAEDAEKFPPTEAQRRTLARWWLGLDRPYGLTIGGPVCEWAFAGMGPDEVSGRYGDGRKVYLA